MAGAAANLNTRSFEISAVVTRADGTVEHLGAVSYRSSNPFKTFAWYLRHPKQWRHKAGKFAAYLRSFIS